MRFRVGLDLVEWELIDLVALLIDSIDAILLLAGVCARGIETSVVKQNKGGDLDFHEMFNSFRRDAGRVSFRFNFLASCDKRIAGRLAHFFAIKIDKGNRRPLGERTALDVLVLPSAISPAEFPVESEYPNFGRIHIQPPIAFEFDPRLLGR